MENCPACKKMEIDTWQQKDVKNYLKESNIEIYYKTLEKDKDFCDGWSVDSYPTNILIVYSDKDKTWKRLETLVGYFDKDNFLTTIKRAIKNDKRRIGFKMLSKNR
jgi:thioredoxin-related protein